MNLMECLSPLFVLVVRQVFPIWQTPGPDSVPFRLPGWPKTPGRMQAKFDRVRANSGRIWPNPGQIWPKWDQISSTSDQVWTIPGRCLPKPGHLWPMSGKFGRFRGKSCRIWPVWGRSSSSSANVGRHRAKFVRFRARFGRCRASLAEGGGFWARLWSKSATGALRGLVLRRYSKQIPTRWRIQLGMLRRCHPSAPCAPSRTKALCSVAACGRPMLIPTSPGCM